MNLVDRPGLAVVIFAACLAAVAIPVAADRAISVEQTSAVVSIRLTGGSERPGRT